MEQVLVSREKYDHLVRLAESEYGPDSTDYDFAIIPDGSVIADCERLDRILSAARKLAKLANDLGWHIDEVRALHDGDLDDV